MARNNNLVIKGTDLSDSSFKVSTFEIII